MTSDLHELWRGTSDARPTLIARAHSTPEARLRWLEEVMHLALAGGALQAERQRRQRQADRWSRR